MKQTQSKFNLTHVEVLVLMANAAHGLQSIAVEFANADSELCVPENPKEAMEWIKAREGSLALINIAVQRLDDYRIALLEIQSQDFDRANRRGAFAVKRPPTVVKLRTIGCGDEE